MEININNAFVVAVKLSCGPVFGIYQKLAERYITFFIFTINFFLENPLLTTVLFSVFTILLIIALSVAFIVLLGVLVFVIIILLVEGFVLIVFVTVLSMIITTAILITVIVLGIRYKVSINK